MKGFSYLSRILSFLNDFVHTKVHLKTKGYWEVSSKFLVIVKLHFVVDSTMVTSYVRFIHTV